MKTEEISEWIRLYRGLFDVDTPQGQTMAAEIERNGRRFMIDLSELLDEIVEHLHPMAQPKARAMIAFGFFTTLVFTSYAGRDQIVVNAIPFVRLSSL